MVDLGCHCNVGATADTFRRWPLGGDYFIAGLRLNLAGGVFMSQLHVCRILGKQDARKHSASTLNPVSIEGQKCFGCMWARVSNLFKQICLVCFAKTSSVNLVSGNRSPNDILGVFEVCSFILR